MAISFFTTITGTVGTTPVQILSNLPGNAIIRVINPTNSHFLASTYDNGVTDPVIQSVGQQITPYGNDPTTYNKTYGATPTPSQILLGVRLVADAIGVPYTIEYSGYA